MTSRSWLAGDGDSCETEFESGAAVEEMQNPIAADDDSKSNDDDDGNGQV